MSLTEFILKPRSPIKWWSNTYVALVRAYGGYIHHSYLFDGLPGSLNQQYVDNTMIIAHNTVAYAGNYNIWEFRRHSTFLIAVHSYPGMPEDAEIALFVTLKAPRGKVPPPKVEVFIGSELEDEYEITNGERSFVVEFDRPPTGTWINIIIRPVTSYPIAFVKATGHIVF